MPAIDCDSSEGISCHSNSSDEKEVLILATIQFKIVASLDQGYGLHN